MKLRTTFWSEEVHEFDKIFYINGATEQIMFQADLNNPWNTYLFFKNIAKFVQSKKVLNTINANPFQGHEYYQFAIMRDGKITHIKWFDLIIQENLVLSHDIAFETTLMKKNNIALSFGKFPMSYQKKLPKYREFNIKARVYKYMANQVKKQIINKIRI
jgi:hypothetical protein